MQRNGRSRGGSPAFDASLCALCGGDNGAGAIIGGGERRCRTCGVLLAPPPTLEETNVERVRMGLPPMACRSAARGQADSPPETIDEAPCDPKPRSPNH